MADIKPILETAAQEFADSTANPPFLFDLPPEEGRKMVDSVQDGVTGPLPVLLFTHGAGWVFGDAHTHGRLVRELTTRAHAATVFTNYSLSPEAKYPTAIEEIYAVLEWIAGHGAKHDLDGTRIAVSGDSV